MRVAPDGPTVQPATRPTRPGEGSPLVRILLIILVVVAVIYFARMAMTKR